MDTQLVSLTAPSLWYWSSVSWRILVSVMVLLVGLVIARQITSAARRTVSRLLTQQSIADSPLGSFTEWLQSVRGSGMFSTLLFWFIMFLFLSIAGEILGLTLFSNITALFISAIPSFLSALIVLFLGVALAGVLERVVKRQLKRVAPQQAVLLGSLTSYVTLALFVLIALSEVGIASGFIMILFAGIILACALAVGIAVGFGAKDLVADMLSSMVVEEKQRRTPKQK